MKTKWIRKIVLVVPLIALLLLPQMTAQSAANVLFETFNDNKINTQLWEPILIGSGPVVSEKNYRLEIQIPANSSGDPFFTGYQSRFKLRGDFDIYVDYRLVTWPTHSGVRVGMGSNLTDPPDAVVERTGHGPNDVASNAEVYLLHTTDSLLGYLPTTDRSGKLRLYRRGTQVRAYYYDRKAYTWRVIATGNMITTDVPVVLAAWSHDWAFGGQDTLVAFDNFTVRIGTLIR